MSFNFHNLKMFDRNIKTVLFRTNIEGYSYNDPKGCNREQTSCGWLVLVTHEISPNIRLLCCTFKDTKVTQRFDIIGDIKIKVDGRVVLTDVYSGVKLILYVSSTKKCEIFQLLMQSIMDSDLTPENVIGVLDSNKCANLIEQLESQELEDFQVNNNMKGTSSFPTERSKNPIHLEPKKSKPVDSTDYNPMKIKKNSEYPKSESSPKKNNRKSDLKNKSYKKSSNSNRLNSEGSDLEHPCKSKTEANKKLINWNKFRMKEDPVHNDKKNKKIDDSSSNTSSDEKIKHHYNSKLQKEMSSLHAHLYACICDELKKDEGLCRAFYDILKFTMK